MGDVIGMQSVRGISGGHLAVAVAQHRTVIDQSVAMLDAIGAQPIIELRDQRLIVFLVHPLRILGVVGERRQQGEDRLDVVVFGQLRHGLPVRFDLAGRLDLQAAGHVVDAGQDHHGFRMQRDDVGFEARQQLGRHLAADAAIDIGLARKELGEVPAVCDGVAEEHDAAFAGGGRGQGGVGGGIEIVLAEIDRHHRGDAVAIGIVPVLVLYFLARRRTLIAVRQSGQGKAQRH